jgi:hypothetical protein
MSGVFCRLLPLSCQSYPLLSLMLMRNGLLCLSEAGIRICTMGKRDGCYKILVMSALKYYSCTEGIHLVQPS